MFARTRRLLLRPGFPEDAEALFAAIADQRILRNLAAAPSPYTLGDAKSFLEKPRDPMLPSLLVIERTEEAPRLVGGCGLIRRSPDAVELGYWISSNNWGRGLATEACTALIDIARTLRIGALEAGHFVDNPASGRVLEKLGFEPVGILAPRMSRARGTEVPARLMRLDLRGGRVTDEAALAA